MGLCSDPPDSELEAAQREVARLKRLLSKRTSELEASRKEVKQLKKRLSLTSAFRPQQLLTVQSPLSSGKSPSSSSPRSPRSGSILGIIADALSPPASPRAAEGAPYAGSGVAGQGMAGSFVDDAGQASATSSLSTLGRSSSLIVAKNLVKWKKVAQENLSKPKLLFETRPADFVYSVALSSDSRYCVYGGVDKRMHCIDGRTGAPLFTHVVEVSLCSHITHGDGVQPHPGHTHG